MNNIAQILCLCLLFPAILSSQFSDNFSDGDLSLNPTWEGDVDNFKVNDIGQLQLDASEAGESFLYIPVDIAVDFTWELDIALNFAPSDNNKAKIYFLIDQTDISTANGYYAEIGENLANDRLIFYRLDAGMPTLLAEGEMGALSEKPAQVSIRVDRVEGLWTISTDYEKQGTPIEELNFFDDTYEFQTDGFFGFDAKYTSSNVDEIFIDNINGQVFVPDIIGPTALNFSLPDNQSILIQFDEAIALSSLDDLDFLIEPMLELNQASIVGANENQLLLEFQTTFESGPEYQIEINGLSDNKGNVMDPASFQFFVPVQPELGDVVINEILFDPFVGGSDYVEIINISDKIIDLQGVQIANLAKEEESSISASILLLPDEIIAFSEDTSTTRTQYQPITTARIHEMNLPSFNKTDGNFSILLEDGSVMDSYDYTEDQHLSLLDETKGVSLERIFPTGESIPQNFTSGVQSTNFGTPGYENANFRNEIAMSEDIFDVENDVFSPNSDGDLDQLIMLINLPDVGYLSTIRIYNIDGQLIKTVWNNQITAQQDIARWDGIMEDGGKAAIGHYIIQYEAFKTSGETVRVRKHVKLLDFF